MFTEAGTGSQSIESQVETGTSRLLDRRAHAVAVARAAEFLKPHERALAKAFFEDGRSAAEIARLAGVTARSVLRRVDRLAARVSSPRFVFVLNQRASLTQTRSRVAAACILHGFSMREAARQLKLPVHCVRAHLGAVNGMFDRFSRL